MLIQRALVALTLGPLLLFIIWQGSFFYFIPITLFILIGANEFISMVMAFDLELPRLLILSAIGSLLIATFFQLENIYSLLFALWFVVFTLFFLFQFEIKNASNVTFQLLSSIAILFLFGWICSHLLKLRIIDNEYGEWTLISILAIWFADSGAYLFGRKFGRNKLAPKLSPKKSWEGYIAGIFLSLIFITGITYFLFSLPLLKTIILTLIIAIICPFGDLAISLVKRESKVKDSGNLFPGHGGALDRLDSVIWVGIVTHYYLIFFI